MQKRVLFLSLLFLFAMLTFVIAQSNGTNSTKNNSTATNNTLGNSTNVTAGNFSTNSNNQARCQALNNRIEGRLKQFRDDNPHFREFGNLRDRIVNVADRLEANGADVTKLRADIVVLDAKIQKFYEDYNLFLQKLNLTRDSSCKRSPIQFKDSLNAAKTQLRVVRQDADDIKRFVKTTIKEDIKNIRIRNNEVRNETDNDNQNQTRNRNQNRTRARDRNDSENNETEED